MAFILDDDLGLESESLGEWLARENMESDLTLMAALRTRREELGLSQSELGALLGITQASVSAFESEDDPKLSTIRRYAHALSVAVSHDVEPAEIKFAQAQWRLRSTNVGSLLGQVPIDIATSKRVDFALAG